MSAATTLTQIEGIMQESIEKSVNKIVEQALERRLSKLAERIVSSVTDELSGLASNVEDVISDALSSAERAGDVDEDAVNELQAELASDISKAVREQNLVVELAEDAAIKESIAELYAANSIPLHEALQQAVGRSVLRNDEVEYLLKFLAENYEEQFAVFLWRQTKNGGL